MIAGDHSQQSPHFRELWENRFGASGASGAAVRIARFGDGRGQSRALHVLSKENKS